MIGFLAGYFLAMALTYGGWWYFIAGVSLTAFTMLTVARYNARKRFEQYVEIMREEERREENDRSHSDDHAGNGMR